VNSLSRRCLALALAALIPSAAFAQSPPDSLYRMQDVQTRWISPENPTGARGAGGTVNKGAKGAAFIVVPPGASVDLADIRGAGIVHRIWISGTIPRNAEQRRLVRLEMYWDRAATPAVNAPIGDFFGIGLGLAVPFESALFQNPEGRSFNMTVPMPFRTAARIRLVNEAPSYALVWYDINYSEVASHAADVLYFHATWRRDLATTPGTDFELLPRVQGRGRYLGTNVGVIGGHEAYRGTWFGEGEVKVFLDGDTTQPTLAGTGTEDYIGTGWGQGRYAGRYFGSLVADDARDLYAFYRFHLDDPVFFHQACRVTLQQMGNAPIAKVRAMLAAGVPAIPVLVLDLKGQNVMDMRTTAPDIHLLLDAPGLPPFTDASHPQGGVNYYRSDDVSATAYFYLDRPENGLPPLAPADLRVRHLKERVWAEPPR
jgi:hypothetical protein